MPEPALLDRLTEGMGVARLSSSKAREDFMTGVGTRVIFIAGHAADTQASAELSVLVQDLCRNLHDTVDCAVVDPALEAETLEAVGVTLTPALIFFRDGLQIGALPGLPRTSDPMARISQILAVRTDFGTRPAPTD